MQSPWVPMQPEARTGMKSQAMTMARHRHGSDRAGAVAQAGAEKQELNVVELNIVPESRRDGLLLRFLQSFSSQLLFAVS